VSLHLVFGVEPKECNSILAQFSPSVVCDLKCPGIASLEEQVRLERIIRPCRAGQRNDSGRRRCCDHVLYERTKAAAIAQSNGGYQGQHRMRQPPGCDRWSWLAKGEHGRNVSDRKGSMSLVSWSSRAPRPAGHLRQESMGECSPGRRAQPQLRVAEVEVMFTRDRPALPTAWRSRSILKESDDQPPEGVSLPWRTTSAFM
jgi:hypothetical protein